MGGSLSLVANGARSGDPKGWRRRSTRKWFTRRRPSAKEGARSAEAAPAPVDEEPPNLAAREEEPPLPPAVESKGAVPLELFGSTACSECTSACAARAQSLKIADPCLNNDHDSLAEERFLQTELRDDAPLRDDSSSDKDEDAIPTEDTEEDEAACRSAPFGMTTNFSTTTSERSSTSILLFDAKEDGEAAQSAGTDLARPEDNEEEKTAEPRVTISSELTSVGEGEDLSVHQHLTTTVVEPKQPSNPQPVGPGATMDESDSDTAVAFGKPFLIRFDDDSGELARRRRKESSRRSSITSGLAKAVGGGLKRTFSKVKNLVRTRSVLPPGTGAATSPDAAQVPTRAGSSADSAGPYALSTGESEAMHSTHSSSSAPLSALFWCADEATRECDMRQVTHTSLLTFHGRRADAVNLKGSSRPLVCVENGAVVTIYANVGGGRYLSIDSDSLNLRFHASPSDVRADDELASQCEFIVRQTFSSAQTLLKFTDTVQLESVAVPGTFLSVNLVTGALQAVSSVALASTFILHSPTLRELVQLNATAASSVRTFMDASESDALVSSPAQGNDFELDEVRLEASREQAWMRAIAENLPVDIAKRIFAFHRDWTRTARLVCKAWMVHAEKSISRIRVNGEFCSLEADEERRALIRFVQRCPNLAVLTLRNVMSLRDEDVAAICENRNLSGLLLGGCRQLSDASTRSIAAALAHRIEHLNLALTQVSDETLRILATQTVRLKELNLYQCALVTADGVNRAPDLGPGLAVLEHINLRGTVIDSHLLQEFKRKKPLVVLLTGPASPDSIYGS